MFANQDSNTKLNQSYIHSSSFFKSHLKKVFCAIFSAMPEELYFINKTFEKTKFEIIKIQDLEFKIYEYQGKKILTACTGLGTSFAASVVTLVYCHFSPEYILFTGTAGGIRPELKIRDVVIVEKAFEAEIQSIFKHLKNTPFESCLTHPLKNQPFPAIYSANEELLQIASSVDFSGLTVHKGTAVSSNSFPAPKELFNQIKNENPYSIDMESSALYLLGWLLGARLLVLRGISNELNHDGSDDKVHESDVQGSAEAAAKALLKILDALILKYRLLASKNSGITLEALQETKELKQRLNLKPHPEGGYYARIYESNDLVKSVDSTRYKGETRNAATSIYYLLEGDEFSAWHSLESGEGWNFHKGCPIIINVLDKQGKLTTHLLGDPLLYPDASLQITIPAGSLFSAEITDKTKYCLVSCTVAPGFRFEDFHLPDRDTLLEKFPQHKDLIIKFTRVSNSNNPEPVIKCRL